MMDNPILGGGDVIITTALKEPCFQPATGFPFDDSDPTEEFNRARSSSFRPSFRHHLDDIASRHPEFAEHLRPWTSDFPTFRQSAERKRHPSGSCGEDDNRSQTSGVSSSSNESNFPSYESKFDAPTVKTRQFETTEKPPHPANAAKESDQPKTARSRPIPQYGLRNTVDLGQKQSSSLDEESRGQRSMSAPPDNRSNQPQQRFVSRVNIEPQQAPPSNSMGGNSSQPKPQPASQKQPNVRLIPILVEGRDEPIINKNVDQTDGHHDHPPEPNYYQPPPDHFFDQNTRFGGPPQRPQSREHTFTQQHHPSYYHYPQQQQQAPPPSQPQPQPQQQVPPPQQKAPPQPNLNDPIVKIQQIQKDVNELMSLVETFNGTSKKDKQYLYLDEMLTRNLLKLDNIETEGKDTIRQARKEAIKCIEKCISILEAKVKENAMQSEVVSTTTDDVPKDGSVVPEPMEQEAIVEQNAPRNEASEKEQMETEPVPPPTSSTADTAAEKQTLEVGGVVKTGQKVQSGENTSTDEKTVDSTTPSGATEQPQVESVKNDVGEEVQKKKGTKSPKKKVTSSEQQVTTTTDNQVNPMEVDETANKNDGSGVQTTANNASQNSNQSATKNES